jgi:hypothetical protein
MTRKRHAGLPKLTWPHLNGRFGRMFPDMAYCVPQWQICNAPSLRSSTLHWHSKALGTHFPSESGVFLPVEMQMNRVFDYIGKEFFGPVTKVAAKKGCCISPM